MDKLKKIAAIVSLLSVCLLVIFAIWDDSVDPPFISNARYDFLVFKLIPILSVLIGIVIIVCWVKKYKTDADFKRRINDHIEDEGKFKSIAAALFSPLIIYSLLWIMFSVPIKMVTYYWSAPGWTHTYILKDVERCGSDYGSDCSRLTFTELDHTQSQFIHWYEDRNRLQSLHQKKVYLLGQQSYFGFVVNEIQW